MNVIKTSIPEVMVFEPKIFKDERGFFFESFNSETFYQATNHEINFVQDNHSKSVQGVLRGLHYQTNPYAQSKLIRVIKGEIFDVAVDLRESSNTFGMWVSEILSEENKKQMWIPKGFAHGFLTLSTEAEVIYKTDNFYSKAHDKCLKWNDKSIKVDWPIINSEPLISEKDSMGKTIEELELF